ncbi:hypothetical protein B0H11DRAFT_2230017 [Mycena galericulata]|nr:hypothetical protein B0H11DRAFT_2230017 [Mycena galericulata]
MTQPRIQDPINATEAMLHELVPGPDFDLFDTTPCPYHCEHYAKLELGLVLAFRTCTWSFRCSGGRCRPQFGEQLPADEWRKLVRLRDDHQKRYYMCEQLQSAADQADHLLSDFYDMGDCPPLPENAARQMIAKLDATRTRISEMDSLVIPLDPEVLKSLEDMPSLSLLEESEQSNKLASLGILNSPFRGTSPGDSDDSDSVPKWVDNEPEPAEEELDVLFPTYITGTEDRNVRDHLLSLGRQVHSIIYSKPHELPYHAICWAPNPEKYSLADYRLPHPLSRVSLHDYDVVNDKYEPADEAINLVGRGKLMIYRNPDVTRTNCRRLYRWEEQARDSHRLEVQAYGHPSVSLSSSKPRVAANAVASSSKTNAAPSSSLPSSSLHGDASNAEANASSSERATNGKRKASEESESSTSKKRKVATPPALPTSPPPPPPAALGTIRNPWIVSSSDGADFDDSDVEVLD